MPTIEIGNKKVEVDEEGFLVNFEDWSEDVARILANKEGVELDEERMEILRFIRDYYKRFNFFPIMHALCKNVNKPDDCLKEEFIDPIVAWKLAGLPKPDENLINIIRYGQTPT